ncbi:MAG: hypothetical protein JSV04_07210 [Candidatus Heimdallarchaeota archaeon]|nr:MAG: hypothetical protein JSV04_07210 [Candidatus Heimdallarchaeota archaeon]
MAPLPVKEFLVNNRVILVRFGGEMGIKSRQTRSRMINLLKKNIKDTLCQFNGLKIHEFRERVIIYSETDIDLDHPARLIANSVSGVSSVSPALVVEASEGTIISAGLSKALKVISSNTSFAVRARREGKHAFSSMDIARKLGAAILSSHIEGIKVDLENPDHEIFLDIRGSLAFVYSTIYKGIDGIPSHSQGTAIAVIKPNYNSIFMAWLMKKRGVRVIPVFFKTGKSTEEDFLKRAQSEFGEILTIVSIEAFLKSFKRSSSLCLLCQIHCEHVSQKIASSHNITTILSPTTFNYKNESMSLESLKILDENLHLSVIRPLQLGYLGQEIEIEDLNLEPCCSNQSKVSIQPFEDFNPKILEEILSVLPKVQELK